MYFIADDLKIKDLHFENSDVTLDHDWHEFSACTTTDEPLTDTLSRDIADFMQSMVNLYS
jgi:hypothetical protein